MDRSLHPARPLPQTRPSPQPRSWPSPQVRPGPAAVATQPSPYLVLGIGALLAPLLGLLPILQYVGWFLASLVHEIGHCIVAWFFGSPAYPAIRIDGHAAAIHGEQSMFLLTVVWLLLAGFTWHVRHRPILRVVMGAVLILHPLLALTRGHEVIHLLAGHGTELAFAGLAFYRAYRGGMAESFSESFAERITYAALAWFLLGKNILMNAGLMMSESARQAYLGNGSFGLEQDFLRAARELRWSLSSVGAVMLLLSLAVIPTLYVMARLARSAQAPPPAEQPSDRFSRGSGRASARTRT